VVRHDIELQRNVHVQCAIHMYETYITVQAIISYKWLVHKIFLVHPRRHGHFLQDKNIQVFIPGIDIEENYLTTWLDKAVAMKWEPVRVGIPVP
jgi:hypothetical protein